MDTSFGVPYSCRNGVLFAVSCYNFSKIACVAILYPYPCTSSNFNYNYTNGKICLLPSKLYLILTSLIILIILLSSFDHRTFMFFY